MQIVVYLAVTYDLYDNFIWDYEIHISSAYFTHVVIIESELVKMPPFITIKHPQFIILQWRLSTDCIGINRPH